MIECYNINFPVSRKIHKCEYCDQKIKIGEKYSYESWKDNGEFFNRKLCLICKNILEDYCTRNMKNECEWDCIDDWLRDIYCLDCSDFRKCTHMVPTCPIIRSNYNGGKK